MSLLSPLEVQAAEAVSKAVPNAEMARFFKPARKQLPRGEGRAAYTGGKGFKFGYHGWHDIWTALNFGKPSAKGVPAAEKDLIMPFEFNDYTSEKSLAKLLEKNKDEVACIIMEPVSYRNIPRELFEMGRKLADEYKTVLIYDEIVTGSGLPLAGRRIIFSLCHITCFAKGISNGFPIAAVTGKREIMRVMDGLQITTTYGGETLSLAATIAA